MSLIFPQFRAGAPQTSGPPSALTVELRPSGPFWQNTARTTPAGVGDPVRVWDDSSGNGLHAVAPSDAERPLRAAAGGVGFGSGRLAALAGRDYDRTPQQSAAALGAPRAFHWGQP